jgi:hypothetical protein
METKYTVTAPGKRIRSHANGGLDIEGYTGEKDQPGDKGCSKLMLADSTKNRDIYPEFIR